MGEPNQEQIEAMSDSAETGAEGSTYSKDYWDNAFEQIGRRPMVKLAMVVLALLYAAAIYAPLIANDRPYYLEAVDYKSYGRAQKTLYAGAATLRGVVKKGEQKFLESLPDEAKVRTYEEAIDAEFGSLSRNLDTMRGSLDASEHVRLNEFETQLEELVRLAKVGQEEPALELAGTLRTEAKALRTDYKAIDPSDPDAGGKVLVAGSSWPLFESTTTLECFFYVLWFFLLAWPFWNAFVNKVILKRDREKIRKWRRKKLVGVLGITVLSSVLWSLTVGGEMTFAAADYKEQLTESELVATSVVWPLVSMGFAESHMAERFRHPTWYAESEINEEGFYVRGARSILTDSTTGMANQAKPVKIRISEPPLNDSFRHPLGTDSIGRDLLVRLLYGGRISLAVGILSTILLVFFGVVMGALAGYFGGWVDILISRIIEIFQSIPAFFLILTAVTMIPDDKIHPIFAIVFFIAIVRWTGVARLVRAEFFRLKEQEFVIAAQALGLKNGRIIFGHVLPNALGPVLVAAAFSVAAGILTESAISFLGLGIKLPIPSWGSLLSDAKGAPEYWWINIFPGVLIFLTVFCYNIVGEGVRDALDPRRRV